jgi:hypothetical protein
MPTIGQGIASFGDSIAGAMDDYHKKHVAYDQAEQLATALSRIGINEQGTLMPIDLDGGTGKKSGVVPVIDPKALELFKAKTGREREHATGAMEALSRIGIGAMATAQREQIQKQIEESGLSGAYKRAATQHLISESAPFTPQGVSVPVPGVDNVPMVTTGRGSAQVAPGVVKGDPHVAAANSLNAIVQVLNPNLKPGHFSDIEAWGNTPGKKGFKTLAVDKDGNPVSPDEWKQKTKLLKGVYGKEYTNPEIANWITLPEGTVNNLSQLQKKAVPDLTGAGEEDQTGVMAPKAVPRAQGIVHISSDDEYNNLESGTQFIAPDGKLRRKP